LFSLPYFSPFHLWFTAALQPLSDSENFPPHWRGAGATVLRVFCLLHALAAETAAALILRFCKAVFQALRKLSPQPQQRQTVFIH
jgi:hypothetical protein